MAMPHHYTGIDALPAGMPPAGVTAQLGGGPTLGLPMAVILGILLPVMVVVVVCRLIANYNRQPDRKTVLWADLTAVGAAILMIVSSGISLSLYHLFRHTWDVYVGEIFPEYMERVYAAAVLLQFALCMAKTSICFVYLQIFSTQGPMKYLIWAGAFCAVAIMIAQITLISHYCAPPLGQPWDLLAALRCNTTGYTTATVVLAAVSALLDFYLLILPIRGILKLNLNTRKKMGVLVVFLAAIFACVCSLATLVYRVRLYKRGDSLWIAGQVLIASQVEVFIAIIIGSVPGMTSFYKRHLLHSKIRSLFSTSSLSHRQQSDLEGFAQRLEDHVAATSDSMEKDQTPESSQGFLPQKMHSIMVRRSFDVSRECS